MWESGDSLSWEMTVLVNKRGLEAAAVKAGELSEEEEQQRAEERRRLKEQVACELEADLEMARTRLRESRLMADQQALGFWAELKEILKMRDAMVCTLVYGFFMFAIAIFVEIFSLWSISSPDVGGLVTLACVNP